MAGAKPPSPTPTRTTAPVPTSRSRPHSPRPGSAGSSRRPSMDATTPAGIGPPPPLILPPGGALSTILSSASLAAMGMAPVSGGAGAHSRNPSLNLPKLDLPPENSEGTAPTDGRTMDGRGVCFLCVLGGGGGGGRRVCSS